MLQMDTRNFERFPANLHGSNTRTHAHTQFMYDRNYSIDSMALFRTQTHTEMKTVWV